MTKSRKSSLFFCILLFWKHCLLQTADAAHALVRELSEEEEVSPSPPQQQHVGIIGAGAAGLTTAYLLQQKGYEVTLIEKSPEVGGFAKTNFVNGKPYDMATVIVPGASIAGPGIEPTLQQMINASGVKVAPALDYYTLDLPEKKLNVIPETLQKYSNSEIVQQLTDGLFYSFQIFLCFFVDSASCAECGDLCANANSKPAIEIGADLNIPGYIDLMHYIFDGLGGGPIVFANLPFISTLEHFFVVEVIDILRYLEVKVESLPADKPQHPNLSQMLSSQRWFIFEEGYQTFFKQLVEKEKMNVLASTSVESLVQDEDGSWAVLTSSNKPSMPKSKGKKAKKTNKRDLKGGKAKKGKKATKSSKQGKGRYIFDQIIVTTAPQDAMKFLSPDLEQVNLLATGVPKVPPNDAFLVKAKEHANLQVDTDADNEVFGFWPSGLGIGSPALVDTSILSVKPSLWQKPHNQDYLLVSTFTFDPALSTDDVFSAVTSYAKDVLDIEVEAMIAHEEYIFPSGPSDRIDWDLKWAPLQGKNGLWFTGEAFSGSGVPSVTQFTKNLIDKSFPILQLEE